LEDKKRLINVHMPEELIERVDDFRFENRFDTRAETMRFLMEWALDNGAKKE
jgi:Arc/MetJ-type ribon-helix-helix transcriptional regulator